MLFRILRNLCVLAYAALVLVGFVYASPVINEIMYRPGTAYPSDRNLEFIEIHNPGTAAVDLSGWAIRQGPNYTFPSGTTIAAGGYLVVAANPTTLQSSASITGVLGPWASGSHLSDRGETISLEMPDGSGGWTVVDSVDYADEGDWATRTRDSLGGWSWVTAGKGGGSSVERRNPALVSTNGQNWAASSVVGGTPGKANSALSTDIAPVITKVKHSPAVPKSTDTVTISCELSDESAASALSATLYWRNATSTSPGSFQSKAMTGDGAGKFSTTLDALAAKQIVEFYVSATDGKNTRTWPAASSEGQNTNCTYQVDDEVITGTAPAYRLILTAAENAAFTSLVSSNPQSDRQFNLTLVATRGEETTIRYRTSMRIRGNSSRSYTLTPLRISMPSDDRWDGVTDFLLNPKAAPLQYLAHKIQRAAGLVSSDATPVELRRQGVEGTVSSGNTADFGKYVRLEDIGGDYVDNHWPDAVSGAAYRKTSVSSWASTGTAPTNPETTWQGWSKQSGSSANDWSDVMNFCAVWQAACASHFTGATSGNVASGTWNSTAFTDAEMTTLSKVADLDYMARWLAVMTILPNNEPNLSTGEDDDYGAAFINDGTNTKMYLIPHDMDCTFGLGDDTVSATAIGLYDATETDTVKRAGVGSVTLMKPLLPLLGNSTTAGNAAFRAKYLNAIRELFGTIFDADTSSNSNPKFYQFVDEQLGDWASASFRSSIKTFMTARQTYLLGLIGQSKTVPVPTSVATATASSTPSVRLNEILVSNKTVLANGSTYPDVIELYNSGSSAVDLGSKCLTDDESLPAKYVFPSGTSIAAGGYLLVYADSDSTSSGLHTGFSLDAEGDRVQLRDTVASGGAVLDEIVFGFQPDDLSISRTASAPGTWALTTPTLGKANGEALALGTPSEVKINEWAGNIGYRTDKDFIELYNTSSKPVALGGCRITDDLLNRPSRYSFRQLGYIPAGGFLVIDTDKLEYGLDGDFDFVFFTGADGSVIDSVSFSQQASDTSTGRSTDGGSSITSYSVPTPGLSNTTALPTNSNALLTGLRITEVMYKPKAASSAGDYEYVELRNIGSSTLDLSGVRFTNGIDYTFASGTTLAAGAYIVVCKSQSAFLARYPSAAGVLAAGSFTGALDNSGETIALTLPSPWNVHVLRFRYESSWYSSTANDGYSLVVVSPTTTAARDWGDKSTWAASAAVNGNPGSDGSVALAVTSALAANGTVGVAFSYQILANATVTSYTASGLPAGLSFNSSTGVISGTPTTVGVSSVTIGVTASSGSTSTTLSLTVSPTIYLSQSSTLAVDSGGSVVLGVAVLGGGSATYQWQRLVGGTWTNLSGATSASYTLSSMSASLVGSYRVLVTTSGVTTASASTTISLAGSSSVRTGLSNLSARSLVGSGSQVQIAGFVVGGTGTKQVLVRAIGPRLSAFGISGTVSDPKLEIYNTENTLLGSNDSWDSSLASVFSGVGAFSLETGSKDAAAVFSLDPAGYTSLVSGVGGATGVGLVELYDLGGSSSYLTNISCRAQVGTGEQVLVAGFVIQGSGSRRVLIRGVGPGLSGFGLSGLLADPSITLLDKDGVVLSTNDNWDSSDSAVTAAIQGTGAFGLAAGSKDSVLLVTLQAGQYTVKVQGADGGTGLAIAEVYEVP